MGGTRRINSRKSRKRIAPATHGHAKYARLPDLVTLHHAKLKNTNLDATDLMCNKTVFGGPEQGCDVVRVDCCGDPKGWLCARMMKYLHLYRRVGYASRVRDNA